MILRIVLCLALGHLCSEKQALAITGGIPIDALQFPYVLPIGTQSRSNDFQYACGAVKIAPNTLLTFSGCIPKNTQLKVQIPTKTNNRTFSESTANKIEPIASIFPIEATDLTILTLRQEDPSIPSVAIASQLDSASLTFDSEAILVGFGSNRQALPVNAMRNDFSYFGSQFSFLSKRKGEGRLIFLDDERLLVSAASEGAMTSLGDQGGAIFVHLSKKPAASGWYLLGILAPQTSEHMGMRQSVGIVAEKALPLVSWLQNSSHGFEAIKLTSVIENEITSQKWDQTLKERLLVSMPIFLPMLENTGSQKPISVPAHIITHRYRLQTKSTRALKEFSTQQST